MPDKEQDLKKTLEFLFEDLKKRIANCWIHIDDKADEIKQNQAKQKEECNKKFDRLEKAIEVLKKDVVSCSNTSFNGLNLANKLEKDVGPIKTELQMTKKESEENSNKIKNISDDLINHVKLTKESFSNTKDVFEQKEKEIQEINSILNEASNKFIFFMKKLGENSDLISKAIELIEKINAISEKDSRKIEELFGKTNDLSFKNSDLQRSLKASTSLFNETVKKLKIDIDRKINTEQVDLIKKQVEETRELAEKSMTSEFRNRQSPTTLSSSWQEQIEIKIARMENKINNE